ncbi:uncharacterized protein BDR25DRAFT_350713 [Lindgomyces ingoldianus]|uniref:Uncharacterized protein n=1 Tax=Lindgomyces ingoldianus TaxID=673940 RepID=A0ACB6R7N8_9PLEO|nr:uncharacterized protein BDR25DRAFT_350713 [Lindgomyces ingoldianus]KAF2475324.1 hypothetical protein BDR25DRAFT_350713 [Lindgomyces ingoldianus]
MQAAAKIALEIEGKAPPKVVSHHIANQGTSLGTSRYRIRKSSLQSCTLSGSRKLTIVLTGPLPSQLVKHTTDFDSKVNQTSVFGCMLAATTSLLPPTGANASGNALSRNPTVLNKPTTQIEGPRLTQIRVRLLLSFGRQNHGYGSALLAVDSDQHTSHLYCKMIAYGGFSAWGGQAMSPTAPSLWSATCGPSTNQADNLMNAYTSPPCRWKGQIRHLSSIIFTEWRKAIAHGPQNSHFSTVLATSDLNIMSAGSLYTLSFPRNHHSHNASIIRGDAASGPCQKARVWRGWHDEVVESEMVAVCENDSLTSQSEQGTTVQISIEHPQSQIPNPISQHRKGRSPKQSLPLIKRQRNATESQGTPTSDRTSIIPAVPESSTNPQPNEITVPQQPIYQEENREGKHGRPRSLSITRAGVYLKRSLSKLKYFGSKPRNSQEYEASAVSMFPTPSVKKHINARSVPQQGHDEAVRSSIPKPQPRSSKVLLPPFSIYPTPATSFTMTKIPKPQLVVPDTSESRRRKVSSVSSAVSHPPGKAALSHNILKRRLVIIPKPLPPIPQIPTPSEWLKQSSEGATGPKDGPSNSKPSINPEPPPISPQITHSQASKVHGIRQSSGRSIHNEVRRSILDQSGSLDPLSNISPEASSSTTEASKSVGGTSKSENGLPPGRNLRSYNQRAEYSWFTNFSRPMRARPILAQLPVDGSFVKLGLETSTERRLMNVDYSYSPPTDNRNYSVGFRVGYPAPQSRSSLSPVREGDEQQEACHPKRHLRSLSAPAGGGEVAHDYDKIRHTVLALATNESPSRSSLKSSTPRKTEARGNVLTGESASQGEVPSNTSVCASSNSSSSQGSIRAAPSTPVDIGFAQQPMFRESKSLDRISPKLTPISTSIAISSPMASSTSLLPTLMKREASGHIQETISGASLPPAQNPRQETLDKHPLEDTAVLNHEITWPLALGQSQPTKLPRSIMKKPSPGASRAPTPVESSPANSAILKPTYPLHASYASQRQVAFGAGTKPPSTTSHTTLGQHSAQTSQLPSIIGPSRSITPSPPESMLSSSRSLPALAENAATPEMIRKAIETVPGGGRMNPKIARLKKESVQMLVSQAALAAVAAADTSSTYSTSRSSWNMSPATSSLLASSSMSSTSTYSHSSRGSRIPGQSAGRGGGVYGIETEEVEQNRAKRVHPSVAMVLTDLDRTSHFFPATLDEFSGICNMQRFAEVKTKQDANNNTPNKNEKGKPQNGSGEVEQVIMNRIGRSLRNGMESRLSSHVGLQALSNGGVRIMAAFRLALYFCFEMRMAKVRSWLGWSRIVCLSLVSATALNQLSIWLHDILNSPGFVLPLLATLNPSLLIAPLVAPSDSLCSPSRNTGCIPSSRSRMKHITCIGMRKFIVELCELLRGNGGTYYGIPILRSWCGMTSDKLWGDICRENGELRGVLLDRGVQQKGERRLGLYLMVVCGNHIRAWRGERSVLDDMFRPESYDCRPQDGGDSRNGGADSFGGMLVLAELHGQARSDTNVNVDGQLTRGEYILVNSLASFISSTKKKDLAILGCIGSPFPISKPQCLGYVLSLNKPFKD